MKIVVISHAMVQDAFHTRWHRLAEHHPVEVTLLVPNYWESSWSGSLMSWQSKPIANGRFKVLPVPVSHHSDGHRFYIKSLDAHLRHLKPDIIYVVQEESARILQQMILYRRLWAKQARLVFFSWNNRGIYIKNWRYGWWWQTVCRFTDMAIAGNQEIKQVLTGAGYPQPVVVQTEIGVNETEFKPDTLTRQAVRAELGLKGVVVGYAGQVKPEKGVLDLVEALQGINYSWQLLIMGDGVAMPAIKNTFADMPDRLVTPGYIPIYEMHRYMRVPDIFVLPSQTHLNIGFKEQFGLVLAQAMACRVPVIGSSSGAIPEVIGDAGLVFPEGDVSALRRCLQQLMDDQALRDELAQKGYERVLANYSATGLADETYLICSQLISAEK